MAVSGTGATMLLALAIGVTGCGSKTATEVADLVITTPTYTLDPGEERTTCFYTTLENVGEIGVRRFESSVSGGSHHVILWTTHTALVPDGTLEADCATGNNPPPGNTPVWTYVAQRPEASMALPAGVGMTLRPRQPVFVELHYLNAQTTPLTVQASIRVYTHKNEGYVRARPFIAYDTQISIPPMQRMTVRRTCTLPSPDLKFFMMSTHSHRFTSRARVLDGDRPLVTTADWAHPSVVEWQGPSFYQFSSGRMTFECDYFNPTAATVEYGGSARTNEMCVGIGYYFPAAGPLESCENGITSDPTHSTRAGSGP